MNTLSSSKKRKRIFERTQPEPFNLLSLIRKAPIKQSFQQRLRQAPPEQPLKSIQQPPSSLQVLSKRKQLQQLKSLLEKAQHSNRNIEEQGKRSLDNSKKCLAQQQQILRQLDHQIQSVRNNIKVIESKNNQLQQQEVSLRNKIDIQKKRLLLIQGQVETSNSLRFKTKLENSRLRQEAESLIGEFQDERFQPKSPFQLSASFQN